MSYEIKLNISENQKKRIKTALQRGDETITIRLGKDDLQGDDILLVTERQMKRICKAYEQQKGLDLKLSKAQIKKNMQVSGGILPLLAAAIPALLSAARFAVPAIATGVLGGLANTAAQKITGNGLYLNKPSGSGLYLKRGKAVPVGTVYQIPTESLVAGDGLLLGPNSPFKNIPFLNVIL